jgi:Peptidase U49
MNIKVLSGDIADFEVLQGLLEDGLVVLETTRPHGMEIAERISSLMGEAGDSQDGSGQCIHYHMQVANGDWVDILLNPGRRYLEPGECCSLASEAIKQWIENGNKNIFIANIELDVEVTAEIAVKRLLEGSAPERIEEIMDLWRVHTPQVELTRDVFGFSLEAGPWGLIKYTHKSMSSLWILGFAAQKAFIQFSGAILWLRLWKKDLTDDAIESLTASNEFNGEFSFLVDNVVKLQEIDSMINFSWPSNIPNPIDGKPNDVQGMMAFDLLCIAGAFCFLHEFKHIIFRDEASTRGMIDEELQCDQFATEMLISQIPLYAKKASEPEKVVLAKRAMGISLVYTLILVIAPPTDWSQTETHPPLFDRIDAFLNALEIAANDHFWTYFSSILLALLRAKPIPIGTVSFSSHRELAERLLTIFKNSATQL